MSIKDKLSQIDNTKSNNIVLSNVYKVHHGGFGLKDNGINTYITSAKVSQLVNDISTFETITKDESWPVSQIIQREIDSRRIKDISSDYILRERDVKYFPPILVAILPRKNGSLSDSYKKAEEISRDDRIQLFNKHGSEDKTFKEFFLEADQKNKVDGLYILDLIPQIKYEILAWNPTKYHAIVIDGQHRLESLKNSIKDEKSINNYYQDVVFIDLSEKCLDNSELTPIKAVRSLFLDINNTSEPVSKARKCLMDDKDLASLFVQQLLDDTEELEHKYLRPQIVDWYSENLKHQLPHLTGVLVLYQLMSDTLLNNQNIVTIDDQRNEKKVEKWKNLLNNKFQVDEQIKKIKKYSDYKSVAYSYDEYKEEISDDDDDDDDTRYSTILFKYDYGILKVATDYFNDNYINSLVYFFENFLPYKKAQKCYKEEGAFDHNNNICIALTKNPKKVTRREEELLNDLKGKLTNKFNDKFYILFTVLGQKTFFKFYFDNIIKGSNGIYTDEVLLRESKKVLTSLNKLLSICIKGENQFIFGPNNQLIIPTKLQKKYRVEAYGRLASSFWDGIIYDKDKIIYNARGILSLSSVLEYLWKFMELNEFGETDEVKALKNSDFNPSWAQNRLKRYLKRDFDISDENEIDEASKNLLLCKAEYLNYLLGKKIEL